VAKITRKRLSRGTKLTPDHTHGALVSAAFDLNNGRIESGQLEADSSSFRVNFHIPYLASDFPFSKNAQTLLLSRDFKFSIPFTLPPAQEMFSVSNGEYNIPDNAPHLVLEEVSFSFDQRAEGAAIVDQRLANGNLDINKGTLDFEEIRAYDLDISILEKSQNFFGEGDVNFSKVVFNAPLSNALFAGEVVRFNPFTVSEINASLSPYKTYAFVISAPLLGTNDDVSPVKARSHALVSVNISMKIKSTLQGRDTHSVVNPIQNMPTKDSNLTIRTPASIGQPVAVTAPVPTNPIIGDSGPTGVSQGLEIIDSEFRHKLRGGVDDNCETSAMQVLEQDAGYEVIAIPLMNNRAMGGIIGEQALNEPYASAGQEVWDRAIIPINYPMVIHHVTLGWNWNRFETTDPLMLGGAAGALYVPGVVSGNPGDFSVEVGLGIGSGLKSDFQGYQQVASHTMTDPYVPTTGLPSAGWDSNLIDRCNCNLRQYATPLSSGYGNGAARPATAVGSDDVKFWEWELHQVPLINAAAPWTGDGYYTNGRPFFVGKSWSPTRIRNDVSPGVGAVTVGREQFLEARMKITYGANFGAASAGEVITGYQGHWLYVIGKKYITR